MKRILFAALVVSVAAVVFAVPAFAQSRAPMEPHRAARIEAACERARGSDWGHFVIGGTMSTLGALAYIPNFLQPATDRPPVAQLGAGLGLGMFASGLILILRPYSAGAVRLLDTCEQLAGPRHGNPTTLRDAERYMNLVASAQRDWALRVGIAAGTVTLAGVVITNLLAIDIHDKFFWSGVFLSVPLAIWLDLLVPPPPVRASLGFQHIVTLGAIAPMPLDRGAGLSLMGYF